MTRRELKNALPQTPDHFVNRMDETLKEIERMNTKSTRIPTKAILIAAALILALAGTAVAVSSAMGIFDHISRSIEHIVPLEGAEKMLSANPAAEETPTGKVEIGEALYADATCKVTVNIVPAEGVTFMFPELKILNAQSEDQGLSEVLNGDGSASYMISTLLTGEQPDVLECEVSVPFYRGTEVLKPITLPITLEHTKGNAAALVPQNESERWSIVSATIAQNDFSMTFDVRYRYQPLPGEEMGVDIMAFDAHGSRIPSGDSSFSMEKLPDGTAIYRQITEIQTANELPDCLVLKPKVIGEDCWLDAIECTVQ